MKIKHILLFGVLVAFASCSTAYRSGQTPDDVYFSPAPEQNSYVSTVNDQDRNSYSYRNDEDDQIRQGIQNPVYRTPITLDLGYGYGYSPYNSYGFSPYSNYAYNGFGNSLYNNYYDPYGYKSFYNPYSSYGYYGYTGLGGLGGLGFYSPLSNYYNPYSYNNSPYYGNYLPGKTGVNTNRGVRKYNLNSYYNNNTSTSTTTRSSGVRNTIETTAPTRHTTGVGNVIRRVFTPSNNREYSTSNNNNRSSNNNDSRSDNTPTRTFNNPPSVSTPPSSSSSSSNSSSAPVRTFRR